MSARWPAATAEAYPAIEGRSASRAVSARGVELISELLELLGEDASRSGLRDTPERAYRALQWLTSGYDRSVEDAIGTAVFKEEYGSMVLVRDIEFYSLCEHHMLPFFGHAHVAYVPDGHTVGLSKIARVVESFARRLQVQERLTEQIAEGLTRALDPRGVGVVVEARHLCMMMRGVEKAHSRTVTHALTGLFEDCSTTRHEFLTLVRSEHAVGAGYFTS